MPPHTWRDGLLRCARNDAARYEAPPLLDLLIRRGKIRQRHRDRDRFLGQILERHLQLLLPDFIAASTSGEICRLAQRPRASQVWICRSDVSPSSTWSLAPAGRLSPSGSCTSAIGARVSADTRMLISTINWPGVVRTA